MENISVTFNAFTMLYNYYLYLVPKHFIISKENPIPTKLILRLPTSPWQLQICVPSLWIQAGQFLAVT